MSLLSIFGFGQSQEALREELADSLQTLYNNLDWARGNTLAGRIPEFFNTLLEGLDNIPSGQRKAGVEITETLWDMTKITPGAGWLQAKKLPLTMEHIFIAPPFRGGKDGTTRPHPLRNGKTSGFRPLPWRNLDDLTTNGSDPVDASNQHRYLEDGVMMTDLDFYMLRMNQHVNQILDLIETLICENRP